MAAAVASTAPVDLTVHTSHPIRLGNTLRTSTSSAKKRSIRYNYRPSFEESGTVKSRLLAGGTPGTARLEFQQGQKIWQYDGTTDEQEDWYVLVLGSEGGKEATLERIDEVQSFNVVKTPDEEDASKLERRHPHISKHESSSTSQASPGEDVDDDQADQDNPFDFRHYLTEPVQPSAASRPAANRVSTPLLSSPRPSTVTKSTRPTSAVAQGVKRKTPASATITRPNSNPKRAKPTQAKPGSASSPKATPVPSVRLDRKASLRYPPSNPSPNDYEEDDGELIIEDPNPNSKPRSSMHLALSGAFDNRAKSGGPISLHSAMSSPAVKAEDEA